MHNYYKGLIEDNYLLLGEFGYPMFVFDAEERITMVNSTLKKILRKSHVDITNINIEVLLKLNGINSKFKKHQLRKQKISVFKYKNKRVIFLSLLTEKNEYTGGVVVIIDKRLQDFFFDKYEIFNSKHINYIAQQVHLMIDNGSITLQGLLENIEKTIIIQILKKTNNKSEAIKRLGVSRRTFYYKLKKYKLL